MSDPREEEEAAWRETSEALANNYPLIDSETIIAVMHDHYKPGMTAEQLIAAIDTPERRGFYEERQERFEGIIEQLPIGLHSTQPFEDWEELAGYVDEDCAYLNDPHDFPGLDSLAGGLRAALLQWRGVSRLEVFIPVEKLEAFNAWAKSFGARFE